MRQPDIDGLLLQLFDIALHPDWSEWVDRARHCFKATSAVLTPLTPGGAMWMNGITAGVGNDRVAAYRDHYHRIDTWTHRLNRAPLGQAHSMAMLVPDHELLASEIYNDFMRPGARRYAVGVTIDSGHGRFALNFGRTGAEGEFTDDDLRALERLARFLPKALATQRMLHAAKANSEASEAVLNRSRRGMILLDALLGVVFFNHAASDLLSDGDVLAIRDGRLVAASRKDDAALWQKLSAAARQVGFHAVHTLASPSSDQQVTASIFGVSDTAVPVLDFGVQRPAVMVDITRHRAPAEIPPEHLVAAFGFTAREARTASLLASGLGLTEVAGRLAISRETVRYHLKGLFAKTGTHSQRELVQLLTRSLPQIAMVPADLKAAC